MHAKTLSGSWIFRGASPGRKRFSKHEGLWPKQDSELARRFRYHYRGHLVEPLVHIKNSGVQSL